MEVHPPMDAAPNEQPWVLGSYSDSTEHVKTSDLVVQGPPGAGKSVLLMEYLANVLSVMDSNVQRGRQARQIQSAVSDVAVVRDDIAALMDGVDATLSGLCIQVKYTGKQPQWSDIAWPVGEAFSDYLDNAMEAVPLHGPAVAVDSPHPENTPGAYWQALPTYGDRPFAVRNCCGKSSTALTRETVAAAHVPDRTLVVWRAGYEEPTFHLSFREIVDSFTVTIRDKQLARDYRAGLLRLVDGILSALRLMLVRLLAALAHQAQATGFLLMLISAVRRYGRRGEPDHLPLPVSPLQPNRPWGAVRLAA
jgi:hypothetical protein